MLTYNGSVTLPSNDTVANDWSNNYGTIFSLTVFYDDKFFT
jgi:hypothetical protein